MSSAPSRLTAKNAVAPYPNPARALEAFSRAHIWPSACNWWRQFDLVGQRYNLTGNFAGITRAVFCRMRPSTRWRTLQGLQYRLTHRLTSLFCHFGERYIPFRQARNSRRRSKVLRSPRNNRAEVKRVKELAKKTVLLGCRVKRNRWIVFISIQGRMRSRRHIKLQQILKFLQALSLREFVTRKVRPPTHRVRLPRPLYAYPRPPTAPLAPPVL